MHAPNKLDELFRLQKQLNQRIGVDTDRMAEAERQQWLLNYGRAMNPEIAELTDCVPWKWRAKYQTSDPQNARVEVADLFHLLISAAQVLGMSADEIFEACTRKHRVNLERQESGYTVKDESDNKHF